MKEHQFDTLAKALAGSVSRREALSRLGGGVAGLLLAALGLGGAWGDPATNSQCQDFCRACPGITPASGFGECVSSCEACVNSTGGQLPCGCPASAGGDVVCTGCCIALGSPCTPGTSVCCEGTCTVNADIGSNVCCLPPGGACTDLSQCCSGQCRAGLCFA